MVDASMYDPGAKKRSKETDKTKSRKENITEEKKSKRTKADVEGTDRLRDKKPESEEDDDDEEDVEEEEEEDVEGMDNMCCKFF